MRDQVLKDILHFHISDRFESKICWGSAEEEIGTIQRNKDWFWCAKRVLDLLEDGDYEHGVMQAFYKSMIGLQAKYALQKNKKDMFEKIKKIAQRKINWERSSYFYSFKDFVNSFMEGVGNM